MLPRRLAWAWWWNNASPNKPEQAGFSAAFRALSIAFARDLFFAEGIE